MPIAWIASTCTGTPTPATTLGAVSLLPSLPSRASGAVPARTKVNSCWAMRSSSLEPQCRTRRSLSAVRRRPKLASLHRRAQITASADAKLP